MKPLEMASYQIRDCKTVKNVQIDPKTTDIWPKQLVP